LKGAGHVTSIFWGAFLHLWRQNRKTAALLGNIVNKAGQTLAQRVASAKAQPGGMRPDEMHTIIAEFALSPTQTQAVVSAIQEQKKARNRMRAALALGTIGTLVTGYTYFKKD